MKGRILKIFLLLMIFGFSAALGLTIPVFAQEVPRESTLIVDIDGRSRQVNPELWNPYVPGNTWGGGIGGMIREFCFYYNMQNGSYMPWLATGWEYSEDYTALTVFLRRGVKWSDGYPFTADDVVFTYKMIMETPGLVPHGAVSALVKEVTKIDDYTVKFQLTKPNPRFHGFAEVFPTTQIGGALVISPKHIWEGVDPLTFENYPPIGTGPYELVYASETEFRARRLDDWWGTEVFGIRPAPELIIYRLHSTDEIAAMSVARHDLDSCTDISVGTWLKLKEMTPYAIVWYKDMPYAHIPHGCERYLDLTYAKYPWNLREVRWAVCHLINKTEVVETAYEGGSKVSISMMGQIGGMMKWYDYVKDLMAKYDVTEYNPDKAYATFEELGFKRGTDGVWVTANGTRLELTVIVPPWVEVKRYGMVAAEQLIPHGIDVVIKEVEAATFGDLLMSGRYDAAALWLCPPGTFEPYSYLSCFHSKYWTPVGEATVGWHTDVCRYKNATLDAILDEMELLPEDDPKYIELFRKAYEIVLQDLPGGVPLALCRKILPFDTYYWIGWPTDENPYIQPFQWMPYHIFVILNIRPRTIDYATAYFTKDVHKFRAIDLVWYGPFKSGDAARIPVDDAEFWIRKGSASYTPPTPVIPTIPTEKIDAIASDVSAVKADVSSVKADVSSVKADVTSLSDKTGALAGQMGTLTAAAAIEGIAIIVLAVALIVVRRK